jgi:hypothetical protein
VGRFPYSQVDSYQGSCGIILSITGLYISAILAEAQLKNKPGFAIIYYCTVAWSFPKYMPDVVINRYNRYHKSVVGIYL